MAAIINKIINICQSSNIFKDTLADISLQELLVKIVQSQTLKGISKQNTKLTNQYLTGIVETIRENISGKLKLRKLPIKLELVCLLCIVSSKTRWELAQLNLSF